MIIVHSNSPEGSQLGADLLNSIEANLPLTVVLQNWWQEGDNIIEIVSEMWSN